MSAPFLLLPAIAFLGLALLFYERGWNLPAAVQVGMSALCVCAFVLGKVL